MTQLGQGAQIFVWNLHTNQSCPYKIEGRSGGGLAIYKEFAIASEIVETTAKDKVPESRIHVWKLGETKACKLLKVRV